MRGVASIVASVACWRPRRSLQQERVRWVLAAEVGTSTNMASITATHGYTIHERGSAVATIYYNIKLDLVFFATTCYKPMAFQPYEIED